MKTDPVFIAGRDDVPAFALTFDDGPDRVPLNGWLTALERGGARGTFFFTGEWFDRHPKLARAIVARSCRRDGTAELRGCARSIIARLNGSRGSRG